MGSITMKVRVVTVDFDNFRQRIDEARECLIKFLACKVRRSSSGEGLHMKKSCSSEAEYSHALALKNKYDDPRRIEIDAIRKEHGLTSDILFSDKWIDGDRKVAGSWVNFESKNEVMNMEEILK